MKQYLDLLKTVKEFGEIKDNRTGVKTLDQFAHTIRFDLRKGFPLLTTKKMNINQIFAELLWFIRGQTNVNELREIQHGPGSDKRTIWDDNYENQAKELGYFSGYLGKIYGYQWSQNKEIDFSNVELVKIPEYFDNYKEPVFEKIEVISNSLDNNIGKILTSNNGDSYQIIKKSDYTDSSGYSKYYDVQFLKTLSLKRCRLDAILEGRITDNFATYKNHPGKMGNIPTHTKNNKFYKILCKRWNHMMERCYDPNCKEYPMYGGKGVIVCKRWHTLQNFLEDISSVVNFDKFMNDTSYQLDKNILGGRVYSKNTCVFIPKFYNQQLINSKPVVYKNKIYINARDFCEKNSWASYSELKHHLKGRFTPKYKEISYLEVPENYYVRYKFYEHNQLKEAIRLIQEEPGSRRIIVNAWRPDDLKKMALPPCHYSFQFNVSADGKYLDLLWLQRQVDLFLGLPYDIASYGLLLSIIAKLTGKTPRFLIGQFGSTHLYENQFEVSDTQLTREPLELPTLKINPNIKTLEDVENSKVSDYQIENYNSHGLLKCKMVI